MLIIHGGLFGDSELIAKLQTLLANVLASHRICQHRRGYLPEQTPGTETCLQHGYRKRAHKLCPYIGFGVGRLIPKRRIAVRGEVGWYLHGKPKLYDGDGHRLHDVFTEADNNNLTDNLLDESSRFAMMCTVSARLF